MVLKEKKWNEVSSMTPMWPRESEDDGGLAAPVDGGRAFDFIGDHGVDSRGGPGADGAPERVK